MSLPIVDPRVTVSAYSEDPTQKKLQLDELKKRIQGGENKEKQLKEACEGFEAVFVQKLWEQMRQTMPKGGYMHSRDEEMYQSMFDVELSKKMASAGGIGLADMLYEQLNAKLGQASRATSTSMLKNKQEIKDLNGEGIPLEPRYGSLKQESIADKLAAKASGAGAQGDLYEEMPEQGVDLRAEALEMQATAGAELSAMQAELGAEGAGIQAGAGLPGGAPGGIMGEGTGAATGAQANPALAWQNTTQSLSAAYMNNMGKTDDPSRVGSFSAMQRQNSMMGNTAQSLPNNPANPAPAAGGLPPNPLLGGQSNPLPNNIGSGEPQVEAFSNNVRGFSGMKKPFANPYSQEGFGSAADNQFEGIETISPRRRTVQGAQEGSQQTAQGGGLNQEVFGAVEGDGPITPLTPPAPSQPSQAFGQEISKNENAVPAGMFLQFDSVPKI